MKLCALALAIAVVVPSIQSRSSVATTARIAGVVTEEGTTPARPVRRALVTVTGTGLATPLQVVSDDNGRFDVAGLPAGRFNITAEKQAYIKAYYGSTRAGRPPGMPVALADGQAITNVTVSLMRGAVITGIVREATGMPLSGAQVQLQLATVTNGERRLLAPIAGMSLTTTDDRGEYRLWGLPPGEYVVRAIGGGATGSGSVRAPTADEIATAMRLLSSASTPVASVAAPDSAPPQVARLPSYFPGVIDPAQAQGIVVAAGDERTGIDIVSQIGRVARVTGRTIGPDGAPVSNMIVVIANFSAGSLNSSPGAVRSNASGEFTVPAILTAGRWLLFGRGAPPGVPSDGQYPWWAETEFVVGEQDLNGVVLNFFPGSVVTGRLDFQGSESRPDLSKLRVSLTYVTAITGVSALVPSATPQPDGTFTFPSVPPGKYHLAVSAAGAWSLRSAVTGGHDVLDTPLAVAGGQSSELLLTMTDRPSELSGAILDQLGRPAPEYSVLVFTADRSLWTVSPRRSSGIVKLGSDGRYRIAGLPAGDYVLCVITNLDASQLNDISLLEQLARAGVPITLGDGEKKVQDFKIGGR